LPWETVPDMNNLLDLFKEYEKNHYHKCNFQIEATPIRLGVRAYLTQICPRL
jgi:hypothetical protein